MTTDNFCFYLQNTLIQLGQTGGQLYNDTSPFSVPWMKHFSVSFWQNKLERFFNVTHTQSFYIGTGQGN
jgi:hypothetical protein